MFVISLYIGMINNIDVDMIFKMLIKASVNKPAKNLIIKQGEKKVYNIRKLQLVELEILLAFKNYCEKNNLNYVLIGGSALGAMRHNGFIPWDDDVDIGMPRNDYEIFLNLAKKDFDDKYLIQNNKTEKNFPYSFTKIRMKSTKFIQENLKNIQMNHGIFIDIFPIDGCGNDFDKAKKHVKRLQRYNYFHIAHTLINSKYNNSLRYRLKVHVLILFKKILSQKLINNRIQKLRKKYSFDSSNYVANFFGTAKGKELIKKEDIFGKKNCLSFEKHQFPVPSKIHEYLTHIYGEYNKIPKNAHPENKHELVEIDYGDDNID